MKNKNPYEFFPNFVVRAPIYPLDFYQALTKDSVISEDKLKQICNDPILRESLFLASPSLFNKMNKWLEGDLESDKEVLRLKHSLLKYISRMSSRCTPFGLFAGCAVGEFASETNIELEKVDSFSRHTRLDMDYLVRLAQDLAKRPQIKTQLLFFSNSSIYEVGHQLRYVEYQYIHKRRHHHIASVSKSEYLSKILKHARKGAFLKDLAELIVEEDISLGEATDFIEELVESQLLISELEPSVSGPEFLTQMIRVLNKLSGVDVVLNTLYQIQDLCGELDKKIGNDTAFYQELKKLIKSLDTEFDDKYLFQTDLTLRPNKIEMDKKIAYSLRRALTFLNKLNSANTNNLFQQFQQSYSKRYEMKEMPLSKVLDLEIGIGFLPNQSSDEPDPILDNLVLPPPPNRNGEQEYRRNMLQRVLHQKILDALKLNDRTIVLKDQDFSDLEAKWHDTPDTLSYMIELVNIGGEEKIKIISSGNSSAANLLGRFCHGDKKLMEHTQKIIAVEENINKDRIVAEIVHLPEARVGNVLMRPIFRKAEIPYLAKSILPLEKQINIDDLMVSIRGNRIRLRSKKHNKEVVPRLTNAHNYVNNGLPIYQFLGSMQIQNLRVGFSLNLGQLTEEFPYIPRIEYQNLILRSASWKIKRTDIQALIKSQSNEENLSRQIKNFCKEMGLPSFVLLIDGDNELLINFENITSVRMWLGLVKNRTVFRLEEFLFSEDRLVKDSKGDASHTNQFIISFYHQERLHQKNEKLENSKNLYHW